MLLTILCAAVSLSLMVIDARRRHDVSYANWIAVIWVSLISSRPVGTWFSTGFGSAAGMADAYDSGSPIDRWVYFVLILLAWLVLSKRKVRVGELFRANGWLVVFVGYCALSVLWSDAPVVGLKRWIKDVGNILMILVIMTDVNPSETAKAVFYRVSALLVPFSFLFIRFIPELGRAYHPWTGEMTYTGVATHKNSLGAFVMVCLVFLVWDFVGRRNTKPSRTGIISYAADGSLILLALYLLLIARSATSLLCAVVAGVVFVALRVGSVRDHIRGWWVTLIACGVVWWVLDTSLGLSRYVIVEILHRDPTLTTRTEVWPVLLQYSHNRLLGAGFNSFWSGERLAELYSKYGIFQAHNGYIEAFLNGGVIGVVLLVAALLATVRRLNTEIRAEDFELSAMKMAMLVTAIIYNFSEAAYSKMSPVWFIALFAVVCCPMMASRKSKAPAAHRAERSEDVNHVREFAPHGGGRIAYRSRG